MESRTKLLGHATHPILVMFPAGLLFMSLAFDLLALITGKKDFAKVAYWNMLAGVGSGFVAAVPGVIDWLAIPQGSRAKKVGLVHAIANDIGLFLFIGGLLLRRKQPEEPSNAALACASAGAAALGLGGYLGGELVQRLGVGVTPGANIDAPLSLTDPDWQG